VHAGQLTALRDRKHDVIPRGELVY